MIGNLRPVRWVLGVGFLGTFASPCLVRGQAPPVLEGPVRVGEPVERAPDVLPSVVHEALRAEGESAPDVRAPKAPPIPVEERRSDDRPADADVWVPGYWSWDEELSKFNWLPGAWAKAPEGRFWVDGTWRRDENGWYRVRGFWSSRRASGAEELPRRTVANWRQSGPPAPRGEDPGPPPGPNTFYVPGHYEPTASGDELVWVPGFWSHEQSGWDWLPARWVRLASGWDYRPGHWVKDRPVAEPTFGTDETRRHMVARPRNDPPGRDGDTLPPAIVDEGSGPGGLGEGPDRTIEPGPEARPGDRVIVVPGGRVYPDPYRSPFRPGYGPYPYSYYDSRLVPRGAVLPYVPPFVRGLLDRVMP